MTSSTVQTIRELFAAKGDSEYGGEVVTQLEHALQCALHAEKENATPELTVAALLHDIGHLLHDLPNDAPDDGIDDRHECSGDAFLKKHFGKAVTQPVKLHVAAKRYLCTVDPNYRSQLSPPSIVSLELQGGEMSDEELNEFRDHEYWEEALELRKWDDLAKVENLETPNLEHYLEMAESVLARTKS